MSPATRAGRICRCPARFVEMLKRIVALAGTTSRRPTTDSAQSQDRARDGAAEPRARRLRQLHRAAADARGRCRRTFPAAPPPIIRRAFMDRRKASSPSTRSPPPIAWRRSISRRSTTASHEIYRTSEPQDLRGPIFLAALALFLLDTLVVLFLGGGIQRLVPRASRAAAAVVIVARRACADAGAGARAGCNAQVRTCRRRRSKPSSPMSSPAMPTSTPSARPALPASRCSWRSAPRSSRAIRSDSTSRTTSLRSIR